MEEEDKEGKDLCAYFLALEIDSLPFQTQPLAGKDVGGSGKKRIFSDFSFQWCGPKVSNFILRLGDGVVIHFCQTKVHGVS
jgi:hypothetical protein